MSLHLPLGKTKACSKKTLRGMYYLLSGNTYLKTGNERKSFTLPQEPGIQYLGLSKLKYTKVMSPPKFPCNKTSAIIFKC